MNINLTLVVQMIVFIVLIWFTMKFVWPMILGPMEERSKKIAAGLAAGEKGTQELAQARDRADAIVREARERATQIVEQAQRQANDLVEHAKGTASSEGVRLVEAAKQQIELETSHAREALRREVATIAVSAASKVLEREIDPRAHADLISKLATQI
ncbi:MAG: F-type H+-transporting ATPase subunit b [Gammaproteobacteria bacterium]|jgi:F-type H+-transporting ATPase subunit b|nr:F-type H+-transporting ATPase subunit b [Gammaproteobacteria bacterium]